MMAKSSAADVMVRVRVLFLLDVLQVFAFGGVEWRNAKCRM